MVLGGKKLFDHYILKIYVVCGSATYSNRWVSKNCVFIMKQIFKSTSYYEKIGLNVARFVFCVTAMFPYLSSWVAHSSKTSFNTLGVY